MFKLLAIIYSICFVSVFNAQVPDADFSVNNTSVCAGFPITFSDQSNYFGRTVISTNWDFGEGGKSVSTNPTYTYLNPGIYQVLLTAISDGGTNIELKLNYITVYPNPTASFTTSGNGCTVPFAVTFNNNSSIGATMSYNWTFGNGQISNLQTPPPITYNAAGTFPVKLIVTNSTTTCSSTITKNLVVSDYNANFTIPTKTCVGDPIVLTDASTVGVDSWSWNSEDGQSSSFQNPTFIFNTPGTYNVDLTSQNSASGCSATVTKNITVNPSPIPTFSLTPSAGCAPLSVTFTNSSSAGTFSWDFGNGITSSLQNPIPKNYISDGTFTVKLTQKNANGCEGISTNTITVGPPTVSFTANKFKGCAPLAIQFTDLSISSNPIADPIVSWLWNFGDGTTSTLQNPPPHLYNSGTFDVSLKITTQSGCSVTSILNDYIQVGLIDKIDFSIFPLIECTKRMVSFTDLSVISTTHSTNEVTYNWSFGDNGTSSLQNPNYEYGIDTGYFDIKLVLDFRGCKDSLIREKQVYIKAPISTFSVPPLFCNPTTLPNGVVKVDVIDDAISGVITDNVQMIWRWDDGSPDDNLNSLEVFDLNKGSISHNYSDYGTYQIKQVINNFTTGCKDSTIQIIHISSMDAGFTLSNDTVCNNLPLSISSNTSIFRDPSATFSYNMGNGDIITGEPLIYNYSTPGVYTIKLLATNSVGCTDSSKFIGLRVLSPPIADFTPSLTAGCLPITSVYTNISNVQGNGVPLTTYLWTYPDHTTQTTKKLATKTHFDFTSQGEFFTTLVVKDTFGCVSDPVSKSMLITKPTVNFVMDGVVCDLENFSIFNNTIGFGALSYKWKIDNNYIANSINLDHFFDEKASNSYTNVAHNIKLVATDENGCKDSIAKTIHISLPKADLLHVASGATSNAAGEYTCPPVFENFIDKSSSYGNISNWNWVFGDGKSSSFQSPSNTYVFPGTYTLSLNVTDIYGCNADTTLVDYLTILGPGGNLNWTSVGDACERKYNFTATNLTYVDSIIWHLDDGDTTFNLHNFEHIYAVGNYHPIGTLIDNLGCKMKFPMNTIVAPSIILSANAGVDQTICGSNATMNAQNNPNGVGTWSLISGSGTATDLNYEVSTITDLGIGENVFRWTIKNACETIFDDVKIKVIDNPTVSVVGADQTICVKTTNLTANTPIVGTGSWSKVSGSGTIANPTNPNTTVSNLGVGINKFAWTISNMCGQSSATMTITVESTPTIPIVGADLKVCSSSTFLDGNLPLEGMGEWTLFSGSGTITDLHSPTSEVTGLQDGINQFVWTISNTCGTNSKTFTVTKEISPTIATVGADQAICVKSSTLSANTPLIGTGSWSIVSGSGTIANLTNPNSTVSNLGVGVNKFAWTILNICDQSSATMTITVESTPTLPIVGVDFKVCSANTTLDGNNPLVGIGLWTLLSGSGTITDPNLPTSEVTGLQDGINQFVWTISNSCATNSKTFIISKENSPTTSAAGVDKVICRNNATLSANTPLIGSGKWSLISGTGILTDPLNPSSNVTGLTIGDNVFEWTITSFCNNNSDRVTIKVEDQPTIADASLNNSICSTSSNLNANKSLIGQGTWTLVSGAGIVSDIHSENSAVTDLGIGDNIFKWTIVNSCSSSSSQVTITRIVSATIANAGKDTTFCKSVGKLKGNKALIGIGHWTVIEGTGQITNPSDSLSSVTGMSVGKNTFRWTISNLCDPTNNFDDVTFTIDASSTISNAGNDQDPVCLTVTNLAGNVPVFGNGTWTLESGSGIITSPNSPNSEVTGLGLGINIFKWTIVNTCNSNFDLVKINRLDPPTIAKVSTIKPICIKNTTLTGNTPIVGTGVWSLVSGSGNITSITNPTSSVTNLGVGTNIFRWTIFNNCTSTSADLKIIIETTPTKAYVGPNQEVCGETAILDGKKPLNGYGTWSLVSGSGKINVVSDTSSGISNLGVGENIFKWTVANSCSSSSAQIIIFNTGKCPDEDSLINELIYYVPNSFTPNSDDFNQTFQPVFSGIEPQKYTFYIFDRWGEIIFESHDSSIGWKGTLGSDDRKAQDGVYTWKIKFTDINTQKEHTIFGHVVLIR
jgi:gliding motility-associated-like protein